MRFNLANHLAHSLLTLGLTIIPCSVIAQSSVPVTIHQPDQGSPDGIDPVASFFATVLGITVTAFGAGGAYLRVKLKDIELEKEQELKEKIKNQVEQAEEITRSKTLDSLYKTEYLKENERRNAIIILGIGGVGKTTLIQKYFNGRANPDIATSDFSYYTYSTDEGNSTKFKYYIADYMGQNIGTLFSSLMEEQKQPHSPLTWGAINSIIFLVDLAKADGPVNQLSTTSVENDLKERVKTHSQEWSSLALDAVFGLVKVDKGNSLNYVSLFINKIDVMPSMKEKDVLDLYEPLIEEISARCRGVYFEPLIGSTKEGTGIPRLMESLRKYSWPKDK